MQTLKKETYREFISKIEEEFNNFDGVFYAFSASQFRAELAKIYNNKEQNLDGIIDVGGGRYILKSRKTEFDALTDRIESAKKDFLDDEDNLLNALVYELNNHEFCVTGRFSDALEALGLSNVDPDILRKAANIAASDDE